MTEPSTISELVESTMPVTCGCGASYDSPARLIGDRLRPLTLYCPACRERRAQEERARAEEAAARRLALAAARRELEAEARERQRVEDMAVARGELAVPPLYAGVSLDSFQLHGSPADQSAQRAALGFARRFTADFPATPGTIAVFTGAPGSGKGHVAWSIARAVVERGFRAQVVKLADLVRELRAGWGQRTNDTFTLEHYRRLDLLVIDEVSRHAFYGAPVQHLYDIIDHRLDYLRPTILTSNEEDAGLQQILSPALWNRIEGHGGVVEFGRASWRSRTR